MSSKNSRADILKAMGIRQWHLRNRNDVGSSQDPIVAKFIAPTIDIPQEVERNPSLWVIVGETLSGSGDDFCEPFSGPLGHFLDQMLFSIGLTRSSVYLCHMNERGPVFSLDSLQKPKLIISMGLTAARGLLDIADDISIANLRGKVHIPEQISVPVVVTYHPRYLLQTPNDKRKSWKDLQLARQVYCEA